MTDLQTNIVIVLMGGACFAIVYKIPIRYFFHAAVLAMLAKLSMEFLQPHSHIAFSTFLTSFAIASISHIIARITGKPAQAFLVPGVMYLVPGTAIYKGFSAALVNDFSVTVPSLISTLTTTAAISFALLLANWVVPSKRTL
ncbi:MAG: threonine/serine exporter family protein [Proteobacteria bacterium]|nr:threonine/serine exporter family protein [Pseudomonadota bacterium]